MGAYTGEGAYCKLLALTWGLNRGRGAKSKIYGMIDDELNIITGLIQYIEIKDCYYS